MHARCRVKLTYGSIKGRGLAPRTGVRAKLLSPLPCGSKGTWEEKEAAEGWCTYEENSSLPRRYMGGCHHNFIFFSQRRSLQWD